jgi:hypothetical protein
MATLRTYSDPKKRSERRARRRMAEDPWFSEQQYENFNRSMVITGVNDSRTFHIHDMTKTYIGDITISESVIGLELLNAIAELTPELRQHRKNLGVGWMNPDDSHDVLNSIAKLRDQHLPDDLTVIIKRSLFNVYNNNTAATAAVAEAKAEATGRAPVLIWPGGRRKKTHRKRKHLKRKTLRKH